MSDLVTVAQAGAVFSASWAIISGVGAWKREFIGKRKVELAEQTLAKFFEVRDAIAYIRNPFSTVGEGKSREKALRELPEESEMLDRAYIVVERYQKKQQIFVEFDTLKYKFMAMFGTDTEQIFNDVNAALRSIFLSACHRNDLLAQAGPGSNGT